MTEPCNCSRFRDTGGFRIADLTCPTHGVDGSDPGDGYWPCSSCGAEGFRLTSGLCDGCAERIDVDPVVVLYALRYALPRASGALSDVAPAMKAAWPKMDAGLREAALRDVREALKEPPWGLHGPEQTEMRRLLGFMERTPDA